MPVISGGSSFAAFDKILSRHWLLCWRILIMVFMEMSTNFA